MLKIILKDIGVYGGIASITGLVIIFISDLYSVTIALSFFLIMLLALTARGLFVINKFINEDNPDGYNKVSTFIKYETAGEQNIVFETYRLIQCKKVLMDELEYNFKWTGKHLPEISSSLQKVENVFERDSKRYDGAILKFKKPIKFNDTIIIHFHAKMNDVEGVSKPHVEVKVDAPIDIIHFRIILKNSTIRSNAILRRKRINSEVSTVYEDLIAIPFDASTMTYEYHLIHPDVGYYYKIEWEKITN